MSDINLKLDRPSPYQRARNRIIRFAAVIATVLDLNPPDYENWVETHEFINKYVDDYNALSEEERQIKDWHVYHARFYAHANISTQKLHNEVSKNLVFILRNHEHPFESDIDLSEDDLVYLADYIISDRFSFTNRIDSVPITREEFIEMLCDYIKGAVPRLAEKYFYV